MCFHLHIKVSAFFINSGRTFLPPRVSGFITIFLFYHFHLSCWGSWTIKELHTRPIRIKTKDLIKNFSPLSFFIFKVYLLIFLFSIFVDIWLDAHKEEIKLLCSSNFIYYAVFMQKLCSASHWNVLRGSDISLWLSLVWFFFGSSQTNDQSVFICLDFFICPFHTTVFSCLHACCEHVYLHSNLHIKISEDLIEKHHFKNTSQTIIKPRWEHFSIYYTLSLPDPQGSA